PAFANAWRDDRVGEADDTTIEGGDDGFGRRRPAGASMRGLLPRGELRRMAFGAALGADKRGPRTARRHLPRCRQIYRAREPKPHCIDGDREYEDDAGDDTESRARHGFVLRCFPSRDHTG